MARKDKKPDPTPEPEPTPPVEALVPTPPPSGLQDLSSAGARLLEAMADPVNRNRAVTDICNSAGVHRATYYRLLRDPQYQAAVRQILLEVAGDKLVQVIEAAQTSALLIGKDGHADRKLLLEMAGVYEPTQRRINEQVGPGEGHTDAELVELYLRKKVPESEWLPSILARWNAGKIDGVAKPVESHEVEA